MTPPLTFTQADPSTRKLQVVSTDHPRQFQIENGHGLLRTDFEREYVSFGGYFGPHDPHLFVAAPEMKRALELALQDWAQRRSREKGKLPAWVEEARIALALARGEA